MVYKPYKGELYDVTLHSVCFDQWDGKVDGQQTLRKYATGFISEHFRKPGTYLRTSLILNLNDDHIETLNSIYRIMSYADTPGDLL